MQNPPSMKHSVRGSSAQWLVPRHMKPPAVERFLLTHVWLPLLAFTALLIMLKLLHGNLWLADRLYALEGHDWALRTAFVTETMLHVIGRDLSAVAWLGVVAAWIVSRGRGHLMQWRNPLAYLAVSTLLAMVLVAWVKRWSNMDCPWDLLRYGGNRPFVGLLELRPVGLSRGVCFPAGHASAGYAWMSLYFFLHATRPRLRWLGLSAGIAVGLVFGISQQLRGAHFLSHDVWTASICWFTALGIYLLFQKRLEARPARDMSLHAGPDRAVAWTALK